MSRTMADSRAADNDPGDDADARGVHCAVPGVGLRDHGGPYGAWRWADVHRMAVLERPNHVGTVARSKLRTTGDLNFVMALVMFLMCVSVWRDSTVSRTTAP